MSGFSPRALRSLHVARSVYLCLERNTVGAAIIGSIALAVHGYVRATRDLDFGVAVFPFASLQAMAAQLRDQPTDVTRSSRAMRSRLHGQSRSLDCRSSTSPTSWR